MKILAHRGIWNDAAEKNTVAAFSRSFLNCFGLETDVRDYAGDLVISHDIPIGCEMKFSELLAMASSVHCKNNLTLAINIKADGLAEKIKNNLQAYPGLDVFVFDMAIPDMRSYFNSGIPVFTRLSEVEKNPIWFDQSEGIWLDCFYSEWFDNEQLHGILDSGKRVCLVSPELHGRAHLPLWDRIKELHNYQSLMICTDYPIAAKEYFDCDS